MVIDSEKTIEDEKLPIMRHSAAHVMAEAVLSIFPDAKFGIGPAIENGFYYDFELPRSLNPDDLLLIETKMAEIIAADMPFVRQEVDKEEAQRLFAHQPYKLELIDEVPDEKVSIYRQGSFVDLCRGPHVDSTGEIGAFKLVSIAGAYWRGDEHRPMLQRIYGVAFDTKEALVAHLKNLEEVLLRIFGKTSILSVATTSYTPPIWLNWTCGKPAVTGSFIVITYIVQWR